MRITRKTGFEEILGSIGTRARRTDFFAEFLSSSTEPIDRTYERYYSYVVCIARTRHEKENRGLGSIWSYQPKRKNPPIFESSRGRLSFSQMQVTSINNS